MQVYELSYLILPSIAEDALVGVVDKIKDAVTASGGSIFDEEAPLKFDLAYTMGKTVGASRYVVNDAYIGWVKFDLPDEALAKAGAGHPIEEINDYLRKMEELIRFLLIKAPRETRFTFAKAKEALEGSESASEGEVKEAEPAEVLE